jgi:CMP-N,N'-diacetyllegionaminic acid synthase
MNGSVYVWLRDCFMDDPQVFHPDTQLFEMPEERSVDIDSPLDFKFVEMLRIQKNSG